MTNLKTILKRLERDCFVPSGAETVKSAVVLSHEEAVVIRDLLRTVDEPEAAAPEKQSTQPIYDKVFAMGLAALNEAAEWGEST